MYIPPPKDKSYKDEYDKCQIRVYSVNFTEVNANSSYTLQKCNEWVYSKKYFKDTLMTDVI